MFATVSECLEGLGVRYAEPHRGYHGQTHIGTMLALLRNVRPMRAPDAAELAAWHHDAVYDPSGPDNEEASARLMRADLVGIADPSPLGRSETMILATEAHAVPRGDDPDLTRDCALLEARARANIERSVTMLRSGSPMSFPG